MKRTDTGKKAMAGAAMMLLAAGTALTSTTTSQAAEQTRCQAIGYIGDSLSDATTRPEIAHRLNQLGAKYSVPVSLSTSSGRAVIQGWDITGRGVGTDQADGTGSEVAQTMKARGVNCFIIALGTNDAAAAAGNRSAIASRINLIMSLIGDSHVDWITPQTRLSNPARPGGHVYTDANMAIVRSELDNAARRFPNLDVNHWERIPKVARGFWRADNIHLDGGQSVFAEYAVSSIEFQGSR